MSLTWKTDDRGFGVDLRWRLRHGGTTRSCLSLISRASASCPFRRRSAASSAPRAALARPSGPNFRALPLSTSAERRARTARAPEALARGVFGFGGAGCGIAAGTWHGGVGATTCFACGGTGSLNGLNHCNSASDIVAAAGAADNAPCKDPISRNMSSISVRAGLRDGATRAEDCPVPGRSNSIEAALGVRLSTLPAELRTLAEEHVEESLRGWAHGWWCGTRIVAPCVARRAASLWLVSAHHAQLCGSGLPGSIA
eukprot:COSAG02_NODE_1294_length_13401_cov_32.784393_6_plen_256_part_00